MSNEPNKIPDEVAARYALGVNDAFEMGRRGNVGPGRLLLLNLRTEAIHCTEPWCEHLVAFINQAIQHYESIFPDNRPDLRETFNLGSQDTSRRGERS